MKLSGGLNVLGTLNAEGTEQARITFTSKQDDTIAGDTMGDGPTTGSPGQWDYLRVKGTASFDYADVRFGAFITTPYTSPNGANEPKSAIWVDTEGDATIDHSRIAHNKQNGVGVAQNAIATISNSLLAHNTRGLSSTRASVTVYRTTIRDNTNFGAYFYENNTSLGANEITYSNITRNDDYGIYIKPVFAQPLRIPHGTQNNIYDNRLSYRDLPADNNPTEINVSERYSNNVDWTGNFWGTDVEYAANPAPVCDFNGRPGRLLHQDGDGPDYSVSQTNQSFSGTACPTDNLYTRFPSDTYILNDAYDDYTAEEYLALVGRHVPLLRYDEDELFTTMAPDAMTDFFDENSLLIDDSNSIQDASRARFAISDPDWLDEPPGGLSQLNLDFLGSTYTDAPSTNGFREGTEALSSDLLSARGDEANYAGDDLAMEAGDANAAYAHVAHGSDGRLWIQYWLFYYFNSREPVHEGDWEMVQVGLDNATHEPSRAAYAQHGEGEECPWAQVEVIGDQPLVYVAADSHASYFGSDRTGHNDEADGELNGGVPDEPSTDQIAASSPSWVAWPGRWGDTANLVSTSPQGPGHGGNGGEKWNDPGAWAQDQPECAPL